MDGIYDFAPEKKCVWLSYQNGQRYLNGLPLFAGIVLSGNEISQILLSLILTYFGGQKNCPKWMSWGIVSSALSCFILAWPHFIYGAGEEALQYTQEYLSLNQVKRRME